MGTKQPVLYRTPRRRELHCHTIHRVQVPISARAWATPSPGEVRWHLPALFLDRLGLAVLHFPR
jgi:hypothetical protein